MAPLPPNRDPPQADGPQPGPPGVGLLRLCAPTQDTVAGCPSSGAAAAALKIENCEVRETVGSRLWPKDPQEVGTPCLSVGSLT